MTPMPSNPVVVLLVSKTGETLNDKNNIGDDLKIVTCYDKATFDIKSAGVPYSGTNPGPGQTQTLAMKKKA
jgi:hypothetical protein